MNNQLEFEPMLSNFLDEGFSNAKGKRQEKKAARKEKRQVKKEMKSVCGRKPLLKKKQGDWQKCVDESKANSAPTGSADDATASKTDAAATTPETKDTTATTTAATTTATTDTKADDKAAAAVADTGNSGGDKGGDESGKILGVSKPVFFIGLAVVAVGGFFAVRHFMGAKGASAPAVS